MRDNFSPRLSWIRLISVLLLPLALVLAGSWLAAQQKKEEEEEPAPKKPAKLPKDEEEEPTPAKPKPPLRVDEDEPAGKKSPTKPAPAARVVDLALAAKNAKGAVRDLFESLIVPHDIVHEIGRRVFVAPLADYVPRKGPFPGQRRAYPHPLPGMRCRSRGTHPERPCGR